MTILAIDDDRINLELIKSWLSESGHVVTFLESGKEAIALYKKKTFDLVLTDILMPNVDGIELIRALRRTNPEIKIIAMSAGGQISSELYLKMAKSFGAQVILTKPLEKEELLDAIERSSH